jgi:murein DD-endopeptidase MepM/ murein hydrolase activator NlpD
LAGTAQYGRPVFHPYFIRVGKEILRHLVCFIKPRTKKVSKILRSILAFSILSGSLFVPLKVEAGFFSSLSSFFVGDQALADVASDTNTVKPPQPGSNLQNPELSLQVDDSSQVQNNKNNDNSSLAPTDGTGTALLPAAGPLGVSSDTNATDSSSNQTSVYVVRQGDNLAAIAKMFGVSVDTILWANNMKKGDKLKEGDVLFILPVSGLEHTVAKGQTLQSIAKLYKVDVSDIIQANDITSDAPLVVGDTLMIPNGMKDEGGNQPIPAKDLGASIAKDKKYYEDHPIQNLAGYFIDPVPGYRLSQGLHDGNAVDMAIVKGTPIHAAAAGTIIFARTGWNGGYGNLTIISHPNGTETLYAHQSKIAVRTGSDVFQGQVIGLVGSTGHSTGSHLHFEVKGARNPGVDGSWKY